MISDNDNKKNNLNEKFFLHKSMKYLQLFSDNENKQVLNDNNMYHNKYFSFHYFDDLYNDNKIFQQDFFDNLNKYNNEYVLHFHHHEDILLQI